jgi:hypothetical protein
MYGRGFLRRQRRPRAVARERVQNESRKRERRECLSDRSVPVVIDGILVGQIAVADILSAEISTSQS